MISHSFADPTPFVRAAHDCGALVLCQVRTVEDAERAADAGVDVVTAQGTEAGGHTGLLSTMPLVPAVVDAIAPLPVIAAGGIADGRGIAAALMLGAEGVWLGTRFLATHECGASDAYKARVIAATGNDTVLTDVFDIAAGIASPTASRAERSATVSSNDGNIDKTSSAAWTPEQRAAYRALGPDREVEEKAVWAGEATTFVTHVESATDAVRELIASTESVLRTRRPSLVQSA